MSVTSGERWWSREAIRVACGPGVEEPPSFGTLLRDHVHVHDRERLIETVNECIRLGTPAETSFRVHHSDGDERYLHARIRVAQRSRERVTRLAGTVQDITSQRRVEAELERHRNNLEELVDDRTRELEQSQAALARSQRLASLGTLAAGMAHQINNPVGGILLAAESALMCAPRDPHGSDSRDDALRDIAVQARRCGSIVRSILTFSHGNPVDKAVSDLRTTVEDAFRAVAGFAERRSAKLRLELANVTLPVRMNPIEIEQVIINLVHNAIESRETGVSVCINGRRLDGHVIVEVHDDGPGIAAPELAHVFDPFYTTRLEQGGTGLGLSVAHGIAIDHGGCLELDSRLNQGTVARLSLPLCARKPEEMKEGSN